MADESSGLWNNLPSIIIVEIFSLLSVKDRLNASSTCKAWRGNLFHPKLWRKVVFHLNSCDNPKTVNNNQNDGARFLSKRCGHFVQEVVIELNSLNPRDVQRCKEVLRVLSSNNNLRALSIKPLSSRLEWVDYDDTFSLDEYIEYLCKIIQQARCLEHLSLGFIEELLDVSDHLLCMLTENQALCIRSLHLSSIKEVPDNYFVNTMNSSMFKSFFRLEFLSIDYDYMNDQLLDVLSQPQKRPLRRLSIHVHSFYYPFRKVGDAAWNLLRSHSPCLEVTLNLLHFHSSYLFIHNILSSEMPLAHFRVYFSSGFNVEILTEIAFLNESSLKSIVLVDELNESSNHGIQSIDPLIMLAWKCKKLTYMKIIGYEVNADSLIAISRLRGTELKDLLVPVCCLSTLQIEENASVSRSRALAEMTEQVSFSLQRNWRPMTYDELPLAVRNVDVDADGAYLEELLEDQTW
ncbi:F-box only protein 33 [Parasteatoda tepidariorum]|uniref:F-box only protein 33 n=1 Tax=Parasteatoda tepidariorum TaxID=114398 RepID=UPI000A2C09CC|nr:F-box only protein 33 [Parasteatoda tepidariorum]